MDYLKIKYRNSCDLGGTIFTQAASAFYYVLYLDVDIGKPQYELLEEGGEDGHKNFRKDLQRLQKKYNFTTVVSEYLYDALAHIQLHDYIVITTKLGETARVQNFTVSLDEWIGDGEYANVTVNFTCDYEISTNCCTAQNFVYQPCLTCNLDITVQDWIDDTNVVFTDPLGEGVEDGQYYLVGTLSGTEIINTFLYYYSIRQNAWIEYPGKVGWSVCFGTKYFYFDGNFWQPYRRIRDITDNGVGASVVVRGCGLPNTFARLYISTDGVNYTATGAVTASATLYNAGIAVSGLTTGVTYYFKFYLYDNNCNYGFSDVISIVKL